MQHTPIYDLFNEPDPKKRLYIPDKIAKIGSWEYTPYLGKLSLNPNEPIALRIECVEALGKLGDPRGIQYLKKLISNNNIELKRTIIWSLGQIASVNGVDTLMIAWNDDNLKIKRWVIKSLGKINHLAVQQILKIIYNDLNKKYNKKHHEKIILQTEILRSLKQQNNTHIDWNYWKLIIMLPESDIQFEIAKLELILLMLRQGMSCDNLKMRISSDILIAPLRPLVFLIQAEAKMLSNLIDEIDIYKDDKKIILEAISIAGGCDFVFNYLKNNKLDDDALIGCLNGLYHCDLQIIPDKYINSNNLNIRNAVLKIYSKNKLNFDVFKKILASNKAINSIIPNLIDYGEPGIELILHYLINGDKSNRKIALNSLDSININLNSDTYNKIIDTIKYVSLNDRVWHIRRDARLILSKFHNKNL